ncbi:MAG: SdrD B-like domain-containing protein [Planctomycetota bacterium]|jgi:hypothetical protein
MSHWIGLESLEPRLLLDGDLGRIACTELLASDDAVRVQYDLPALQADSVLSAEGEELTQLVLGDAALVGLPGQPLLPVISAQIVLPFGVDFADLAVTAGQQVELLGVYELQLAAQLEGAPEGAFDGQAAGLFDVIGVQRRRGVDILAVNLHPVLYDAGTGEVAYYTSLSIEVSLTESADSPGERLATYRPDDVVSLAQQVDNPDALASYAEAALLHGDVAISLGGLVDPAETYDYVVITNDALATASADYTLADFVAHKQALGYSATMVTVEDITVNYAGIDEPEQIRNFITDAYANWQTDYVLIAGDVDVVPARTLYVRHPYYDADDASNFFASDMYYQCLDGSFNFDGDDYWGEPTDGVNGWDIDFLPEVTIGRASAETAEEMANWVYKTVEHELDVISEHRWRAAFVGEWFGRIGVGNWAKYKLEELRLGAETHGYATEGFAADDRWIATADDTLYERDLNVADDIDPADVVHWYDYDVVDLINSDLYGVINHAGHALTARLMKMTKADVETLTNDNAFFLYSSSCLPGKLAQDNVIEAFTTGTRHGAYAAVVNTSFGWSYNDDTTEGPSQHLFREFWDAMFGEGITQLGAMNADSHVDSLAYAGMFAYRWVIMCTTLFGDPAMQMTSNVFTLGQHSQSLLTPLGESFSMDLVARNGIGPITWNVIDGALPTGLTLNTATGEVSGTATLPTTTSVTIQATDGTGAVSTASYVFIVEGRLEMTTTELPDAVLGESYSFFLEAVGGAGDYTWTTVHPLLGGLTLEATTGEISGTVTEPRYYEWRVVAELRDSGAASQSARRVFTLTYLAPSASIAGQVFGDTNGDGARDGEEVGVDGWTVFLLDRATGELLAETVTESIDVDLDGVIDPHAESGLYSFDGIDPDTVDVRVELPAGWTSATILSDARIFALRGLGSDLWIEEIAPETAEVIGTFAAPASTPGMLLQGLAVGPDRLFLVDNGDWDAEATIWELDINTGAILDEDVTAVSDMYLMAGAAYFGGRLYIQIGPNELLIWDPAIDAAVGTLSVDALVAGALTAAHNLGLLFASNGSGNIIAIDPADGGVVATYATGLGPLLGGLAYSNGELLAAPLSDVNSATVYRIDPTSGAVLGSFELPAEGGHTGLPADVPGLAGDVAHNQMGVRRYVLGWGDDITGADFAITASAAIGGQVFYDLSGDGVRDTGEAGLSGMTIELLNALGDIVAAEATGPVDIDGDGLIDPDTERGRYLFDDLLPSTYTVRLSLPNGYWLTAAGEHTVTLVAGDVAANLDFGAFAGVGLSVVSGQVFDDVDFDGDWGIGESPLSGRAVELVDTDTGHAVASAVTAGGFELAGIAPGDYELRMTEESPWATTSPAVTYALAVTGDQVFDGNVFGVAQFSSVSGQVFEDVDGDGVAGGPDDVGLDGRTVELVDIATGWVVATAQTTFVDGDGDGRINETTERGWYEFLVTPGEYQVRHTLPAGWRTSVPEDTTYALSLVYGQAADGLDFGGALPVEITGQVFGDWHADGLHYWYEDGVNGVTVELARYEGGPTVASTVTASDDVDGDGVIDPVLESGLFSFTGLLPGSWSVRIVPPETWSVTTDTSAAVTLAPGKSDDDIAFGVAQPARISGQIFNDANGNGLRDPDEPGLNDQTVELVDTATGNVLATTVTGDEDLDGNGVIDPATERGLYEFAGFDTGNHEVRYVVPYGREQTSPVATSRLFAVVGDNTTEMTFYEIDPISGVIRNTFAAPAATEHVIFQGLAAGPEYLYYVDSTGVDGEPIVWTLDPDTGAVISSHPVTGVTGANVLAAAYLDDTLVLMVGANEVVVWDLQSNSVADRFGLGRPVTALAADDTNGVLYGAAEGNAIVVIDPAARAITNVIPLGDDIAYVGGLAVWRGELLVSPYIEADNTIFRVDPTTGEVIGTFELIDGPVAALGGDGAATSQSTNYLFELGWGDDAFGQDFGSGELTPIPGDVNLDGVVDAADIDLMFAALDPSGEAPPGCDLDNDGDLDPDDITVLVEDLLGTTYGDANLDGRVDVQDMKILRRSFRSVDAGWAAGDFTGDGQVDMDDFRLLLANVARPPGHARGHAESPSLLGPFTATDARQRDLLVQLDDILAELSPLKIL